MNYNAVPSLKHVALIRTAVILWNQDDVTRIIKYSYYRALHKCKSYPFPPTIGGEWCVGCDKVEEICGGMVARVTSKVPKLPIPNSLKEDLVFVIKPIGEEMLRWVVFHDHPYLRLDLPSEVCWLPQGTVDKKQTAKLLIKDENIDIIKRYKLACIYCLEDEVRELWKKIPWIKKKIIYSKKDPEVKQKEFVVFWTCAIMGEVDTWKNDIKRRWKDEHGSAYQFATEHAAITSNTAAISYFLQKLTPAEKEKSLMKCAVRVLDKGVESYCKLPRENHAVVLKFLLSKMNEQQQLEFLKNNPYGVLSKFLKWPCQRFFMETAKRMGDFLDKRSFKKLLWDIFDGHSDKYKDYNYHKLFKEFWIQNPISNQKYVKDGIFDYETVLFPVVDKENLKLILENASTLQRKNIIFSPGGKNVCESLAYRNDRDLLKFFIEESISSKDVMIEFREAFKKHVASSSRFTCIVEKKLDMWDVFSRILDDLIEVKVKKN